LFDISKYETPQLAPEVGLEEIYIIYIYTKENDAAEVRKLQRMAMTRIRNTGWT
jgi:hypothetical protein